MNIRIRPLAGALLLAVTGQAAADTTTQAISGSQSAQENGCVNAIGIFTTEDCSYNGKNRWAKGVLSYDPDIEGWTEADTPAIVDAYTFDIPRNWIGPLANQMYYETGNSPIANGTHPEVGDAKAALGLSGQISIDDNNTPGDGSDDLISGDIVIAAGTRNVLTGNGNATRVEESWDSLTQTLAPTTVDSATPNGLGGFDYVIASRGIPERLQPAGLNSQPYPSEIASSPIMDPAVAGWVAPDSQGRSVATFECLPENPTPVLITWNSRRNRLVKGSHLGADCADPTSNNIGATTSGAFSGWSCIHSNGGNCPNNPAILGAASGDAGYQNLLLAISTNADGEVVSSNAFYAHQYQVLQFLFGFSTPWEAWDGGELVMTGTGPVVTAAGTARPGDGSPDINIKSGGVIPVVLYSNDSLDATQVTDLRFGPQQVGISHISAHVSDENGDNVDDIVAHFSQVGTGIACGDTSAILTGVTADGLSISAAIEINTVGC